MWVFPPQRLSPNKSQHQNPVYITNAAYEGPLLNRGLGPVTGGCGKLLLSGLSVSDSPLLSDRCCRHRSMHHTFVKKRLSSAHPVFRRKSTAQSHRMYIYTLADTLVRRTRGRAGEHADKADRRACARTHTQTQFPLWWQILPELASICESWRGVLYESNSPVICLSQMDLRGVCRGLVWWPWPQDGFIFRPSSGWRTNTQLPSVQVQLWKGGGQVNHRGLTKFNPLKRQFTPALLGRLNRHADPIFSVYISVLSPRLLFALIMGLAPVTPIWNLALTLSAESYFSGYSHKG